MYMYCNINDFDASSSNGYLLFWSFTVMIRVLLQLACGGLMQRYTPMNNTYLGGPRS